VADQLRILVLTSSTGGGHDARAQAFAEWCFVRFRHGVNVRIEQMLEKSSVVNRTGVNFYNWIQLRLPGLHKLFYAVVELLSFLNRNSVTLGRAYYRDVLLAYRPHLILSVHDCLNRGYFPYARKLLGANHVKCVTYCGEFSGGWGYSRNWIEASVDLYISRTATARQYALKLGIPPERAIVRGHLMRPRASESMFTPQRRKAYREERLALKPNLFTVFLATGGNGANNHLLMLPALLRHSANLQVIAICGRNKQIYNELVLWRSENPALAIHIEGYTDVMHELMQVSDFIVTRGGTTSCAKALHFGCPIVFNAFGGIMPQESLTWKFFHNGAATAKIENAEDFASILDHWMANPKAYEHYRDDFLSLRYKDDQAELIEDIVQLAEQAAELKVRRFC
jgi:processive 1,2-diacylglycerol beta-glucosyltransferase